MPPKGKHDIIAAMASRIFDDMVAEIQLDIVLRARQDAERVKRPCRCCGQYCSLPHSADDLTSTRASGTNNGTNALVGSQGKGPGAVSSGSGTPTKDTTNVYLTCPVCKRQFASNRCAAHLATCMGLSTGSRRGARNAKSKLDDSSNSPYIEPPDEVVVSASQSAKSKKKDSNGNGKRPPSPSVLDTPTKKLKKQKVGSTSEYTDVGSASSSQTPSRLRKSSTASSAANGMASPSPSAYSSDNTPASSGSSPSTQGQTKPQITKQKQKPAAPVASTPVTSVIARGPPGSSKGRSIAAARLHGEGDGPKPMEI
ncbi:hypothetical protein CPB86DRAFT_530872 [Serendipita vermifera]|nr:hypothetical protein CPB86DRAFT_530872 [Serendipita vermifera]